MVLRRSGRTPTPVPIIAASSAASASGQGSRRRGAALVACSLLLVSALVGSCAGARKRRARARSGDPRARRLRARSGSACRRARRRACPRRAPARTRSPSTLPVAGIGSGFTPATSWKLAGASRPDPVDVVAAVAVLHVQRVGVADAAVGRALEQRGAVALDLERRAARGARARRRSRSRRRRAARRRSATRGRSRRVRRPFERGERAIGDQPGAAARRAPSRRRRRRCTGCSRCTRAGGRGGCRCSVGQTATQRPQSTQSPAPVARRLPRGSPRAVS